MRNIWLMVEQHAGVAAHLVGSGPGFRHAGRPIGRTLALRLAGAVGTSWNTIVGHGVESARAQVTQAKSALCGLLGLLGDIHIDYSSNEYYTRVD